MGGGNATVVPGVAYRYVDLGCSVHYHNNVQYMYQVLSMPGTHSYVFVRNSLRSQVGVLVFVVNGFTAMAGVIRPQLHPTLYAVRSHRLSGESAERARRVKLTFP